MPSNIVVTTNVVGNREDLIDKVFMISPTDTPFVSAIDKSTAAAVYHEWQTDVLSTPVANNAAAEGADASYLSVTPTTRLGNFTQIISAAFSVSNTQEAVRRAGPNEIARQKAKQAIQLKKDIEASAIANGVDASGTTRQMKGLTGALVTNYLGGAGGSAPVAGNPGTAPVAGTNRAFSEALLKSGLLLAYQTGGNVSMAMMRPADKQLSSTFTGNVTRFNDVMSSGKETFLQTAYTVYGSDFGNVSMVPNRVMSAISKNSVYCIDTDMFALATLRPFDTEELGKTGDGRNFLIAWEGTLEFRNEQSSAQIADLS